MSIVTDAPLDDGTAKASQSLVDKPSQQNDLRTAKGVEAVKAAFRWCVTPHVYVCEPSHTSTLLLSRGNVGAGWHGNLPS